MKALSIKEPWISMIADGSKTIETRSWKTNYRGLLLLVGSKKPDGPHAGKAACIADLVACQPMIKDDEEYARCAVYEGAYSWHLSDIRPVKPVSIQGWPSLYNVDDNLIHLHLITNPQAKRRLPIEN